MLFFILYSYLKEQLQIPSVTREDTYFVRMLNQGISLFL